MDPRIRRATLALAFPLAVAAFLGGSGCSSDEAVKPASELKPPTAVTAVNGDDVVTISWTASPDQSRSDFESYYIYRWTTSLADTAADHLERYRVGIAQKTASSFADDFPVTNGQNGVRYYYHVRSKGNGISIASNEVQAAGRPEGAGMVIEEFAGNLASGFCFALGDSISLRVDNPDRFILTDFYLGTIDPENDPGSPLAVKSPSTLEYLNSEWASVITGITEIGTTVDDWNLTHGAEPTDDQSTATLHHVYAFKTPSDHYAKIQITGISGNPPYRIITFKYAYQTTPGLYLF